MQETFTIELRVDYTDRDKTDVIKAMVRSTARHLWSGCELLRDNGINTKIAVHSSNWFAPPEEIGMWDDTIQQGLDQIKTTQPEKPMSDELLNVFKR